VGKGDGAGDKWGDEDDIKWVALRAFRTSVGEGISVLRYLASGVMSCIDREPKCRLKASEASMPGLGKFLQHFNDKVRIGGPTSSIIPF